MSGDHDCGFFLNMICQGVRPAPAAVHIFRVSPPGIGVKHVREHEMVRVAAAQAGAVRWRMVAVDRLRCELTVGKIEVEGLSRAVRT